MFFFKTEFGESKFISYSMLLNESPIFYDTRRTICCLSFPSTDRATAPGVVHVWVGQKHLNCFMFKCFTRKTLKKKSIGHC